MGAHARRRGDGAAPADFDVHIDEINRNYPSRVDRLGGRVDPISQSIKIIGRITGDARGLLPGMSGRAMLTPPRKD